MTFGEGDAGFGTDVKVLVDVLIEYLWLVRKPGVATINKLLYRCFRRGVLPQIGHATDDAVLNWDGVANNVATILLAIRCLGCSGFCSFHYDDSFNNSFNWHLRKK